MTQSPMGKGWPWSRRRTIVVVVVLLVIFVPFIVSKAHSKHSSGSPAATQPIEQLSDTAHTKTGLTGFGASRAEWNASHEANPDPNLAQGCCYGPNIDGSSQWNLSASGNDVISAIDRAFPARTAETTALGEVAASDLPADAVLSDQKKDDPQCNTYVYTSHAMATSGDGLGSKISVSLYSPGTDYNPANTTEAILSPTVGAPC